MHRGQFVMVRVYSEWTGLPDIPSIILRKSSFDDQGQWWETGGFSDGASRVMPEKFMYPMTDEQIDEIIDPGPCKH